MSVRNKPNYGIFPIVLTVAGSMDMPVIGTRIAMVTAISGATFTNVAGVTILAGGTVAPSSIVNVQVGKALGDPIPFSVNTKISVEDAFDFVRFSWAAQPGVTAFMLIDDDRAGAGVFVDAPSPILGGSIAIQQGGNTAIVTTTLPQFVGLGGALQVDETKAPTPLGASFANVVPAAAGVTTFLAAASNTKGCWLRSAFIYGFSNGTSSLYVDTAAPTGTTDTSKRCILGVARNAQPAFETMAQALFLPAGVGIFAAASAADATGMIGATWDLVQ